MMLRKRHLRTGRLPVVLVLSALLATLGCGSDATPVVTEPDPTVDSVAVPAQGTDTTLDIATWNVEFFGSASGGPADDALQLRRVRDVVVGAEVDVWSVQEISDGTDFRALVDGLPGYSGLLADDLQVASGPAYYSDFGGDEHKVGIVYRSEGVQVRSARIVLTDYDYEFAGRPPLEIQLTTTLGGSTSDWVLVVLHAKANTEIESWERRRDAAEALRDYLDREWPDTPVIVAGDWNDDVDESITSGRDTPYRGFVDAAPQWVFLTESLSEAGQTTILGFDEPIDHILASDEAAAWLQPGSVSAVRLDLIVPNYTDTTSDHLPVIARFSPGG